MITRPRVIVTDKNPSYGAAKKKLLASVEHRQHKRLNNRAEVSHQPTRQKERQMKGFKSPKQAQIFLSNQAEIYNLFKLRKRTMNASEYREKVTESFTIYRDMSCQKIAA